jgi:hypothetical protein
VDLTGDVSSANMSPSAIVDEDAPVAWGDRFGVDGAESAEAAPVAEIVPADALEPEEATRAPLMGIRLLAALSESDPDDRSDEDDARRRARSSDADMSNPSGI